MGATIAAPIMKCPQLLQTGEGVSFDFFCFLVPAPQIEVLIQTCGLIQLNGNYKDQL